ncbi:MAG: MCE family protein [Gammaproteobacteria bacterium]|nr:MCE family protein [Gammaproteobacteria bacterium]
MNSRTRYIFVGLFVSLFCLAFVGGILWLGSGGSARAYDNYVVRMQESVAGLSRDSAVKYYGVAVGRVAEIDLDPNGSGRVRLLLQIDKETPVYADTVATLEIQGLTGLAYINLSGGSQDSPPLKAGPGQAYPEITSHVSGWGQLNHRLGDLLDGLADISRGLQLLLSEDNQRHLAGTLANLDSLSAALASRSTGLVRSLDNLADMSHNAREASAQLPELVRRLQQMADEIAAVGVTVGETVAARDRDLQRFSDATLPGATAMINQLNQAARSLRRFSEALERNPGMLLKTESSPAPGPGE